MVARSHKVTFIPQSGDPVVINKSAVEFPLSLLGVADSIEVSAIEATGTPGRAAFSQRLWRARRALMPKVFAVKYNDQSVIVTRVL
jgi:hypothetical protein